MKKFFLVYKVKRGWTSYVKSSILLLSKPTPQFFNWQSIKLFQELLESQRPYNESIQKALMEHNTSN